MRKSKEFIGVAVAIISSVLFGLSFLFTKEAVTKYSALTVLSWRFLFAFASLGLCALTGIIKVNFRGKKIWPLLLIAFFQPILYFTGETIGISLTTASESGTIISCIPIVTIIMCYLVIHEPPTKLQIAGVCISVVGVVTIVLVKGLEASLNVFGYFMLVVAMVSDSLFVSFSRRTREFNSAEKTLVQAGVGAIGFTLVALIDNISHGTLGSFIEAPFVDTSLLTAVLYLAVGCQVIAFLMCNYTIEVIGAARASSFAGITTAVSVLAGVIVLKESFSLAQGIGTGIVLAGVYMANHTPRNARTLPPEALDTIRESAGNK